MVQVTEVPCQLSVSSNALFDVGASKFKEGSDQALNSFLKQVESFERPDSVVVHVHTDNLGTKEFNRKLSFRRARALVSLLRSRGAFSEDTKLSGLGFGFSRPVGDNKTAEGRMKNRRIEVIVAGGRCE